MKKLAAFLLAAFSITVVSACTTFCINKDGHIVFGRNYDWVTGAGIVNSNLRGLFKTSLVSTDAATISWVSKYGSLTFNQYGKEFPTGGMNENGLVVELMWLDGTTYPKADDRPGVRGLQWIQYQLDNSGSVEEVIASDTRVRINERATPLHFLVADAKGNVATIEFIDGRMMVHQDKDLPFPVLTNNTYEYSSQIANRAIAKHVDGFPSDNSLDRFVKACGMVKKFRETDIKVPITDYAFTILDKVSQGNFTKWSIVYDITSKEIHFRTDANRDIKKIRFAAFEFACSKSPKMFNMNQDLKGDISNLFTKTDTRLKEKLIDQAIVESSSRVEITPAEKKQLLTYENTVTCKQ